MNRTRTLILALVLCLSLCACGNGSSPAGEPAQTSAPSGKFEISEDGKIILTKEFLEDEEHNPADAISSALDFRLLWRMNSAADARNQVRMTGWGTKVKFSSYEVTDVEFLDDCTIRVYGKLYGKTVYDDPATCTFTVDACFEESEKNESGYSVDLDNWGLGAYYSID